ncbi:hypothetical protein F4779DRAFT_580246 [Xylariaceae sp. FL0662B]|nr:hypothetical protein F4779DRAFT_580246 [Xylariaceae sp. FL0662B]
MRSTTAILHLIALLEASQGVSSSKPGLQLRELASLDATSLSTRGPGDLVDSRSVSFNVDCNKLLDQVVGFISKYPEYSAKVLGITASTALAYNVCRTLNKPRCEPFAGSVASALTLAVWAGKMVQNPPSQGSQSVTSTKARRRASLEHRAWLKSELEKHLQTRAVTFDSVSQPIPVQARDESEPESHFILVRGLVDENGFAADHHITVRGDGAGHVQLAPSAPETDELGVLNARANSAGFKITWDVVSKGHGVPEANGYNFLCTQAANDWAERADSKNLGDYIGGLDFGSAGAMQFRIIPETKGFGDGHEDSKKCH